MLKSKYTLEFTESRLWSGFPDTVKLRGCLADRPIARATSSCVVNADGSGGPRRLTAEHVGLGSGHLRWSPDSAAIGFLQR